MVQAIQRDWYRIEDPLGRVFEASYDQWAAPQQVLATLNLALEGAAELAEGPGSEGGVGAEGAHCRSGFAD